MGMITEDQLEQLCPELFPLGIWTRSIQIFLRGAHQIRVVQDWFIGLAIFCLRRFGKRLKKGD
jgi:hypothetical protein